MKISGHTTESIYRRYAIVAERDSAGDASLVLIVESEQGEQGVVVEDVPERVVDLRSWAAFC